MNVNDIAYAIDCEGELYNVFPIWKGDKLAKLTGTTGESFRLLLGGLFDDYTLLDHRAKMIKVTFYPNIAGGKEYHSADFQFRTFSELDKFIDTYQYLPGYRIFGYDVWEESDEGFGLRTLGANDKSFIRVALALGLKVMGDF